jgi:hypothetical protein
MRSPSCLCTPHQLLNARTNLYETSYVYHGTWAHLNGTLHKPLPSVCPYVYPLSLQGNGSVNTFPRLTTHLHLMPRSKEWWSYTSTRWHVLMAWCVIKFSTGRALSFFCRYHCDVCRSQWPCGLRHELSSLARTLGSWLRIPLEA